MIFAANQGNLLPVRLDNSPLALELRSIQHADLRGWRGDREDHRFRDLVNTIASIAAARVAVARPAGLVISPPPRVFISYSHDSVAHENRVMAFANRLRADGIAAMLDQYEQSPGEGWPAWYIRQIEAADFVLMVCTDSYYRQFITEELKKVGVVWMPQIILQKLSDVNSARRKFIPILFSDGSPDAIPTPLKTSTWYVVDRDADYKDLCRRLALGSKPDFAVFRDIDAPWCPEMVVLPAGEYLMGSLDNEGGITTTNRRSIG